MVKTLHAVTRKHGTKNFQNFQYHHCSTNGLLMMVLEYGRGAKYANSIHENINTEMKWSKEKIEFLDTLVKIENGRIITDLYRKPTDMHLYIL